MFRFAHMKIWIVRTYVASICWDVFIPKSYLFDHSLPRFARTKINTYVHICILNQSYSRFARNKIWVVRTYVASLRSAVLIPKSYVLSFVCLFVCLFVCWVSSFIIRLASLRSSSPCGDYVLLFIFFYSLLYFARMKIWIVRTYITSLRSAVFIPKSYFFDHSLRSLTTSRRRTS